MRCCARASSGTRRPDSAPGRHFPPGLPAQHLDVARRLACEPEQDAEGRGLARAVRTQEAVHLARRDGEVEPIESVYAAVVLGQAAGADHCVHIAGATPISGTCEDHVAVRSGWAGDAATSRWPRSSEHQTHRRPRTRTIRSRPVVTQVVARCRATGYFDHKEGHDDDRKLHRTRYEWPNDCWWNTHCALSSKAAFCVLRCVPSVLWGGREADGKADEHLLGRCSRCRVDPHWCVRILHGYLRSGVDMTMNMALMLFVFGGVGVVIGVLAIVFRVRVLAFVHDRYRKALRDDDLDEEELRRRLPTMTALLLIASGWIVITAGFICIGLIYAA